MFTNKNMYGKSSKSPGVKRITVPTKKTLEIKTEIKNKTKSDELGLKDLLSKEPNIVDKVLEPLDEEIYE